MASKSPQKTVAQQKPTAPAKQDDKAGFTLILKERTDWQDKHIERFLEMPLVDPSKHKVSPSLG